MLPSLYSNLAHWWPLLSPPSEYEEEAAVYAELFQSTARPAPKTLLEIGSGGGSNAFHLKQHFTLNPYNRFLSPLTSPTARDGS